MSDDLITFLRARLDEDEEVARATRKNEQFVHGTDRWFASHSNAITSMAPHRAITEVEAKREILDEMEALIAAADDDRLPDDARQADEATARIVLRLLAKPYSSRPEYAALVDRATTS